MGKTEPLSYFTSDSVRCSSSGLLVLGNREVVAIDVDRWPSSRQDPQGESEEAAEGAGKQKPEEGQAHDSSADITISGEPSSPEQGEKQIPDLNASLQQKQKRRKHRPEVILEGKPKRPGKQAATTSTPKSSKTAEKRKYVRRRPSGDTDNPRVKRKYVRKNELFDPLSNSPVGAGEAGELKGSERIEKSCGKVLNFDNESEVNDAGLEPRATPGDRANPILLSDTDTDQEKELAKISDCTVGIRHAKGDTVIEKNSVSCSADPTCRSRRLNMSQAQRSSLHTFQELGKNVFKRTPASVLLADLVNHRRATSRTLSTTNSRNDGKLPREVLRRLRCGQKNPASALIPRFQDSISDENNKATSTVPEQDFSAEISSLEDLSANPTFFKSHARGKSCIADIGSRDQARSARKNRSPKRKQTQNFPSEGNTMVRQQNESHSTSIGKFEWFHIVPHIDAIREYLFSVDEIAEKLKDLDINGETGIQRQQCSALGPCGTSYQTKSSIVECRRN